MIECLGRFENEILSTSTDPIKSVQTDSKILHQHVVNYKDFENIIKVMLTK